MWQHLVCLKLKKVILNIERKTQTSDVHRMFVYTAGIQVVLASVGTYRVVGNKSFDVRLLALSVLCCVRVK